MMISPRLGSLLEIIHRSSHWRSNPRCENKRSFKGNCEYVAYISQLKLKNFKEAENEQNWILAMQKELGRFEMNKVWTLVPRPTNYPIIGTKWVFRNKMDELGNVVRNKARLVAQGYNQEVGIDFDETFAP